MVAAGDVSILLFGHAAVGKSYLVREFIDSMPDYVQVLRLNGDNPHIYNGSSLIIHVAQIDDGSVNAERRIHLQNRDAYNVILHELKSIFNDGQFDSVIICED